MITFQTRCQYLFKLILKAVRSKIFYIPDIVSIKQLTGKKINLITKTEAFLIMDEMNESLPTITKDYHMCVLLAVLNSEGAIMNALASVIEMLR
jgi:hypothetical protein